jgi:hypothetical protein
LDEMDSPPAVSKQYGVRHIYKELATNWENY